ncbi:YybH family protein [Bacteroidota bacterium]
MMRYTIFLLTVLFLAGCAADEQDIVLTPDFSEYSKAAALTWNDAWADGDAAKIANQYTEDAMLLSPGGEAITGRDAIREFWTGAFAAIPNSSITSLEAGSNGDLAFERGTYSSTGPDGEQLDHGKYVVVWTLVDGEWKMFRDIWNSSVAVATPESE